MKYHYDVESYDYAWLNLDKIDLKGMENPMENLTTWQQDNFHLHVLKVMSNPKYFHWTVKQLLNIDLLPAQVVILQELWTHSFPMYLASRGFGKSFMLAVYAILRCLLIPETKIVIVGAAFRQSKVIFEYMATIWKNAPILRSVCSNNSGPSRDVDRCTMRINNSWTIAVPLGTGEKIRGLRAHTVIADEFNSIPVEIYETVVEGFAAVSKDPSDNVREAAKRKKMKADDVWSETQEDVWQDRHKNQSIISGTAGYDFEPYADYWRKYRAAIKSKGDLRKVNDDFREGEDLPEYMTQIDPKEFSIIRIPYALIPEGFMSDEIIGRARATMHTGTFNMEYGAVFAKDSQGFFKRTLIESVVAKDKNVAKSNWPEWCPTTFDVSTRGRSDKLYVFGIDPASEIDNFAITIQELYPDHQRLVYVWVTNKKDFSERKKLGLTDIDDYYSFCVRKIRDLKLLFPCVRIGIDSQGGGYQIAEGLRDSDKIRKDLGEVPIYPIIEDDKEKDTDHMPGDHILELVNFASAEWTSNANHGLRKDMEDKAILFPRFDQLTLGMVSAQDEARFKKLKESIGESSSLKVYDTLEDCIMNIEDLKAELSTIIVSRTASGREKFDTPEIKIGVGKKGRMRKDRYSALMISNSIARTMRRELPALQYEAIGRVAAYPTHKKKANDGRMYYGHGWENFTPDVTKVIRRN